MSARVPVCAHLNVGPYDRQHFTAGSIQEALREFRLRLEKHYGTLDGHIREVCGEEHMPGMSLYPQCTSAESYWRCSKEENLHDYPSWRFTVGRRGGIKQVSA